MVKWEYNTVFLTWDANSKKWKSGETTEGRMYELLDRVGEQGWELVSFTPALTETQDTGTTHGSEVMQYIAIFKRAKA